MKTDEFDKKKHYVIVKNDSGNSDEPKELTIAIEELFSHFEEKNDMRIYNYFQALIRLSASMCLDRNYKCIKELMKIYKIDQVIHSVLNANIENSMRANFAKLLINLHIDKDPLEKLVVPIMTRKWNDIDGGKVGVPESRETIPQSLMHLKKDLNLLIASTNGVLKAYETDFNELMLQALRILETMIGLGFYKSEEELIDVTNPIILILNGCTDYYDP